MKATIKEINAVAILVTLVLALIGWFVAYNISNHFHKRNQRKSDINNLISRLEEIQHTSLLFWQDTNHVSTYADQLQLINQFKTSKMMIEKLCTNDCSAMLGLHKNAWKVLTNTPPSITDFSEMDKSSSIFRSIYSDGNKCIQQLIAHLNKI